MNKAMNIKMCECGRGYYPAGNNIITSALKNTEISPAKVRDIWWKKERRGEAKGEVTEM